MIKLAIIVVTLSNATPPTQATIFLIVPQQEILLAIHSSTLFKSALIFSKNFPTFEAANFALTPVHHVVNLFLIFLKTLNFDSVT